MNFTKWLDQELKKRNWNRARLAKEAGFSEAAISLIFAGKRNPGTGVCKAIANALGLPEIVVYRQAGILPEDIVEPANFEELKYWFNQMDEAEQELFLAQGRLYVEHRNKRKPKGKKAQLTSQPSS